MFTLNGREIDTSCPYENDCWADQYCLEYCPTTLLDVLRDSATKEHELGFTPHTDPDLSAVCPVSGCQDGGSFMDKEEIKKKPKSPWYICPGPDHTNCTHPLSEDCW